MERPNIEEQMNAIIGSGIKMDITEHKKPEPLRKEKQEVPKQEKRLEPSKTPVKVSGKITKRMNRTVMQKLVDDKIDRILGKETSSYLLIREATGECLEIRNTITVGSEPACDFVIGDNPTISRFHAQLETRGGKVHVRDTSMNGTYVNGRKLSKNEEIETSEGIIIFSNEKFRLKRN